MQAPPPPLYSGSPLGLPVLVCPASRIKLYVTNESSATDEHVAPLRHPTHFRHVLDFFSAFEGYNTSEPIQRQLPLSSSGEVG